jgi:hypothetical protein
MPQSLSSKDHTVFRQLVKHYEEKHYKKGEFSTVNLFGLPLMVHSLENGRPTFEEKP